MSGRPLLPETILEVQRPLPERVAAARTWLDENLRNDPKASRDLIEALLPQVRATGDATGEAWLRFQLGWLAIDADDVAEGISVMESVRQVFEDLGDREGVARCLNALGYCHSAQGAYDLALDLYRASAKEAEKVDRLDLAGAAAMNMAECLQELEAPEEALQVVEHFRQHYEIASYNLHITHATAGLVYRALGRLEEAERELRQSIQMAGDALHDSLEARQILAEVCLDLARFDEAEAIVRVGLEACTQAGERMLGTRFRLTRARLSKARGLPREAIPDIEAAIASARELGSPKLESDAEKALYLAWRALGAPQQALDAFVRHTELKEATKSEQTSRRILGLHDERIRRETQHFETLYRQISAVGDIGRRLTASLDLDATFESIYGDFNTLMDAPTLLIALVDEEKASLDYRLVMIQGQRKEPFSCPLDQATFGCWCVQQRRDVLIGDLEAEYRQYVPDYSELIFDGTAEKSLIFVPLFAGDKLLGVLSVQSHLRNAYDRRKVETVRAIGAYIAIAIENARLFSQVQRLATIDGLTGVLNRRRLTETIEDAHLKAKRYVRTAGILMIDLDHFKRVNDTYGHEAGDEVLRTVSRTFSERLRSSDAIGRFGGEEFVVLLPETDLAGASALAERLRKAVADLKIQLPGGQTVGVTASFGVSVLQPEDPTYEAVLRRADQALYRSKQAGRNRIEVGENGTPPA